jgi:hypothetical protein
MMTEYQEEQRRISAALAKASFSGGAFPRRKTVPPTTSVLPLWPCQVDWLRKEGCVLRKGGDKYYLLLDGRAKKWYNRSAIACSLYGELVHVGRKEFYVIFG